MSDRRGFLKGCAAGAGIFFADCGLVESALGAWQPAGARKRREVVVGGRRVRTVDVHGHVYIPEVWELVKDRMPEGNAGFTLPLLNPSNAADRIAEMDKAGVDVQVVANNPNFFWAEPALARQIIKVQNEKVAELCAAHPDRFVGLCSVALQHPDMAAQQLEEAVKKLGMRGAAIGAMVNRDELSAEKFNPFWAKAEELGALIFIHPMGPREFPEGVNRFKGKENLVNLVGIPLATTLALSHLIFDGTLDRYPGLRICASHGGGYLPSYIGRSDKCVDSGSCDTIKKRPSEYLKRMYFDCLVYSNEGLRHLIATVGIGQIVLGTDYPFGGGKLDAVDFVLQAPGLSDANRRAILGGNAAKLLGMGA